MTRARRLAGYTLDDWERLEPEEGHRVELVALAVEVVSPSTARRDRLEKPAAFAAAGVPAFWRVEIGRADGPVIYCYRLDQDVYVEVATLRAALSGRPTSPAGWP